MTFPKPKVVISKCIEFDHCRYNGQIISSDVVKELKPFVDFVPICPEVEIDLGIPRDPIRIVIKNDKRRLIQPATRKDLSEKMMSFSTSFLQSLEDIDGFILKTRSPSCGIKDVNIYIEKGQLPSTTDKAGFFGSEVLKNFSHLAIEDEGRLRNPSIREHFLRKIFRYTEFRQCKQSQSIASLVEYHSKNKFLLMAYNQKELKTLGQIVANKEKKKPEQVFRLYEKHLYTALNHAPRCTSNINVLMHCFGYVSSNLSSNEKKYFFNLLEQYREAKISLATIISILKSWMIRFNPEYLSQQTFFQPYPSELLHAENIDSCLNRNYWK